MPSGKQIRAARMLVDWNIKQLAEASGLTELGVQKIETGNSTPRPSTLNKIVSVFNEAGIEFKNGGVFPKHKNIDVLEGAVGFTKFLDTVYEHVRALGGIIRVSGVEEAKFEKYDLTGRAHRERMTAICEERGDINMQILVREGDYNFLASQYASYRWVPKEHFSPTTFYVFGDYLALISFENDPPPIIFLIQSAAIAGAYRQTFNMTWEMSGEIPNQVKK